jgi:Ca2+-binding RTX toxin-like protein
MMSESNHLELSNLREFFEHDHSVGLRTGTEWSFTGLSGDFKGDIVTLIGSGFNDSGDFPASGIINEVDITDAHQVLTTYTGLNVAAATALSEHEESTGSTGSSDHEEPSSSDHHEPTGSTASGDHSAGGQTVVGGHGDDNLNGGDGDDNLTGGDGNDTLNGGRGKDILSGGGGDDVLNGGGKADTLTGAPGADTFKFDAHFGHDTITDFTAGQDKIDLSATGLTFAQIHIQHHDGHVEIVTHQGTIDLTHVTSVHHSDFVF